MRTGLTISAVAHAGLLAWGLISFSARPLDATPKDALPVDIISTEQFSQLTKGAKDAPKVETPKPVVDKVAEQQKLVEDSKPKVADKQEIKTASAEPPPAPAEAKPEAKPDKKQPDPIAEALKKEEAKKKAEAKAKAKAEAEQKKKLAEQPRFDANQIAALLDKRNPQRVASTGSDVATPTLGVPTGTALRLSQNELDAMRARLMQLWSMPAGVQNPEEWVVRVRVRLGPDRKLVAPPQVLNAGRGSTFETARDSALRAIYRGQPYDMLTTPNYEIWKDVEIIFDPRDMGRG